MDFYTPPTIQEMERDNPEQHLSLIYDTAMDMIDANTVYTGKTVAKGAYEYAFTIHVLGIKNSMTRGTAIARKGEILFFHPGTGEYVRYNKELQKYLLEFIPRAKESVRILTEAYTPYTGRMS